MTTRPDIPESIRGPWLSRLHELAGKQPWTPIDGRAWLFGENCLVLKAAREALTDSSALAELRRTVRSLLNKPETLGIYGQIDDRLRAQGQELLSGLGKTILAVCRSGSEFDYDLAAEAADHFDCAWPLTGVTSPSMAEEVEDRFRNYQSAVGGVQGMGFWVVWDILDRLIPTRPDRATIRVTAASLPVLLVDDDDWGHTGLLTVELIHDGGSGFRPDPFGLGLTALHNGNDDPEKNFHQALQWAWEASGLKNRGCRGRWWLSRLPRSGRAAASEPCAISCLSGRSLEAAVCCALWTAHGGCPGEDSPDDDVRLDPWGTITATLEAGGKAGRGELLLGPVEGLTSKLAAARRGGLELVLVAPGQKRKEFEEHHRELGSDRDPVAVKTVEAAFEQLLAMQRHLKNNRAYADQEWNKLFASAAPPAGR